MSKNGKGYEVVLCKGHPRANDSGFVYEHILVAENKLGRYLKPEEVVHHLNENKGDNRPENLLIFATLADHTRYHMMKDAKYYIDEDGVAHCDGIEYKCERCGKPVGNGVKFCSNCRKEIHLESIPSRNTLKRLIRSYTFMDIGKMFNVSDNAIHKWCKGYGLPYRATDIKKYNDYEWENEVPFEDVMNRIESEKEPKEIKKVEKLDINTGEVISIYNNTTEAKKAVGAPRTGSIVQCCDGKRKTAYGFRWRYKIEYIF